MNIMLNKKIILLLLFFNFSVFSKNIKILNVSYDTTRELYEQYNPVFIKYYKNKTGIDLTIQQSHGGSAKQAISVIHGIKSDVVTLALAYDIDNISKYNHIDKNWIFRLPNNSSPYTSTILFIVRKGNPKNIFDWEDLAKSGISIVTPNPKSSGGARWNYLAAWGYALDKHNGNKIKTTNFIKKIFKNVIVQDFSSRNATHTFLQKKIGDVLIAWENEAYYAIKKLDKNNVEIITPSTSILTEPSITIVDKIVNKKNTKKIANDYLLYLYSKTGQEIIAKNFYRPRDSEILQKYSFQFKKLNLFTIDSKFNGWNNAYKEHFIEGGTYDKIMSDILYHNR